MTHNFTITVMMLLKQSVQCYQVSFYKNLLFYWKGRNREEPSICWPIPQMSATARPGPAWSQETGTQSCSPTWMAEPQATETSSAASQGMIGRKPDCSIGVGTKTKHFNLGSRYSKQPTHGTKSLPQLVYWLLFWSKAKIHNQRMAVNTYLLRNSF